MQVHVDENGCGATADMIYAYDKIYIKLARSILWLVKMGLLHYTIWNSWLSWHIIIIYNIIPSKR